MLLWYDRTHIYHTSILRDWGKSCGQAFSFVFHLANTCSSVQLKILDFGGIKQIAQFIWERVRLRTVIPPFIAKHVDFQKKELEVCEVAKLRWHGASQLVVL